MSAIQLLSGFATLQPPVVSPPITGSTMPVMYEESASEARNTYAGAISSGCAGRPIGFDLPNSATFSGVMPASEGLSGVHTGPGATALTRMPFLTSSEPRVLVSALIAPLVDE